MSDKIEIYLNRGTYTPRATIGLLKFEDYDAFILEDPVRKQKVYGETAIPAGRYRIVPLLSPSRKHLMPYLMDVPNFTGIQIHPGNTPLDTRGCLIPGKVTVGNAVYKSTEAYMEICERLCTHWNQLHEVWITIKDREGYETI